MPHRLIRLLSALSVALCLPLHGLAQNPAHGASRGEPSHRVIHLGYLFSDGNIPGTLSAYHELLTERPDLKGRIKLSLLAESTVADTASKGITSADVLVFDTMNEQMLAKFNASNKTDLIADVQRHGTVLGVGEGLLGSRAYISRGVDWDPRARAYWEHAGPRNTLGLMKLALTKAGIEGLSLPEPQRSLDFGYYYPDGQGGRVFPTWEQFDAWRAAHGKEHPGAPRVAIGFFKATYYTGDTDFLDALIAEVERQGAEAIPVFGYPGPEAFERLLLDSHGQPRADVGLGANFQFVGSDAAKILEKVGIPVINVITLYGRSEKDWRKSATGLSTFEGTFDLVAPELAGTIAPTVVGTKEKIRDPATGMMSVITRAVPSRVRMAVSRALKYAALRRKANADKRIALLFYDYPPGKADIGASYLNVAESLAAILRELKSQGYDIGSKVPTSEEVLTAITTQARNIGISAPGELRAMLSAGHAVRVPMAEYRRWLDAMAPSLKAKIIKDWGKPEKSTLMAVHGRDGTTFVIPMVRYGKIVLMPQPARAWGADLEKLYHAKDLAPTHQYVAAYAWLRNDFKADAVVHVGTHGTLEWLNGRDVGLAEDDAPDALIGNLPDIYIYNVDVVGEGLVARRRAMAELVDHMVPPFKPGGLTTELAKLSETMNDQSRNESKNPQLADTYLQQIREQAIKLGIAKDLDLEKKVRWTDADVHKIEDYLFELKDQKIPYGLHTFGRTPGKDAIDSTVQAIVSVDRSKLPENRKVSAADMRARIVASGPRELADLGGALAGRFVPAGLGGEPIRNPDSYATGNDFYGIDPDKVPKPAAWVMGSKLAEQMLEDHLKKTGKPLEKVSFVIWGDETMRSEGVLESEVFYLLGTKPVWDARGNLVGVLVVPRSQLGRPRVDIVIACAAAGLFSNVTHLMDEAVQRVKMLDEADNVVRQHYLEERAALIKLGTKPALADRMAGVRIFDEPPGTYDLNTSTIVANSGSWDSDTGFANDYIRKMGHGYGNGFWGEDMEDAFRLALSGTQTVVHSSSTALYGALDNDDMFMYVGGLASAIRSLDGKNPQVLVADSRDPSKPAMTDLSKFIGREFRSRYVNPTWIKGMQKEGYAGAAEMRSFVEYLWGWDATVPGAVDDAMWQQTFDTYVEDSQELGMKAFFESKSPFAYQDITARMLETIRKGYWTADARTRDTLLSEYIESIKRHGVNCTEVSCGDPRLLEYVLKEAARAGVPAPDIANARAQLEKAMGKSIESAAKALQEFAQHNDARELSERNRARHETAVMHSIRIPVSSDSGRTASSMLKGMLMTEEQRSQRAQQLPTAALPRLSIRDALWPALILLGLILGWRWREHARRST